MCFVVITREKRVIQYSATPALYLNRRGVLDARSEPVIGRRERRPVGGHDSWWT